MFNMIKNLFVPQRNILWAIKKMKKGHLLTLPYWPSHWKLERHLGNFYVTNQDGEWVEYSLTADEVESTQWQIVEAKQPEKNSD